MFLQLHKPAAYSPIIVMELVHKPPQGSSRHPASTHQTLANLLSVPESLLSFPKHSPSPLCPKLPPSISEPLTKSPQLSPRLPNSPEGIGEKKRSLSRPCRLSRGDELKECTLICNEVALALPSFLQSKCYDVVLDSL